MAEITHPPHLHEETQTGSSFIPFCAYKTNMTISEPELWLPNISFPICTSFKPTILEGQLCYKIQVNATSGMGNENELALLVDYQGELSIHTSPKQEKKQKQNSNSALLNFNTAHSSDTEVAKVHIDTLSSFMGLGGGNYAMTAVKRMTAKEDFLKMPLKERNCEVELFENCRTRKLLEECNCVPWELSMPANQVYMRRYKQHNYIITATGPEEMQP